MAKLLDLAAVKDGIAVATLWFERAFRGRSKPESLEPSHIRNFLFLQYEQPLGTAVHASPVFEALKHSLPDAHVAVACHGMVAEVLRHNPHIDQIIATPNPYERLFGAARTIRRAWMAAEPRCVITTAGSTRTRVALLGILCGRAVRVGHTLAPRLYHKVTPYDRTKSLIENNLSTLTALGLYPRHTEPRVFFSRRDLDDAMKLVAAHMLDDGRPIAVLVTQTSGGQRKAWPEDRLIASAKHLHEAHRCHLIFIGTAKEVAAIDALQGRLTFPSVSLAGHLSIPALSAFLCMSDVCLTLDTGPLHVGRAAGLPMVLIAPAWQPVIEWLPLGQDRFVILRGEDIPFAPPNYAIDEVTVDQAIRAIDHLMGKYPPSPAMRQARVERSLSQRHKTGE